MKIEIIYRSMTGHSKKIAKSYDCTVNFEIRTGYPSLINNTILSEKVLDISKEYISIENIGQGGVAQIAEHIFVAMKIATGNDIEFPTDVQVIRPAAPYHGTGKGGSILPGQFSFDPSLPGMLLPDYGCAHAMAGGKT